MITFSVMIDTRAESASSEKVYGVYEEITDATTLCNAKFDVAIKKVGQNSNVLANIGLELEQVNEKYDSCRTCFSKPQTDPLKQCGASNVNACADNRYADYKKLATKCEGSAEEKEQVKNKCDQCIGLDKLSPNDPLIATCAQLDCTTYREEQEKPSSNIEVTDKKSCENACDLDYAAGNTFGQEKNQACKKQCAEIWGDEKKEEESGGLGIHIGTLTCEGIAEITSLVGKIYRFGIVFLVAGMVLLSMADYGKAVMSDNQDAMKKANKHLVTRIIIIAIYVFLPLLINMALHVFLPNITTCLDF